MDAGSPLEGTPSAGLIDVRSGLVDRIAFQRWALSVGEANPIYFDAARARRSGHPDVVMPPMFVPFVVVAPTPLTDLGPDGSLGQDFGTELGPGTRLMAGGERIRFSAASYPGDEITARRYLESTRAGQGRQGPFRLIVRRTSYANQRGELVAVVQQTVLARPEAA